MIWDILLVPVSLLYVYWLYQMVIAVRGFAYEPPPPRAAPRLRFAIVVSAHDEEVVVGHLVDSLVAQEYSRELFDVYVVADACTDGTEAVAEERGARVLAWRGEPMGKTRNLGWAFKQIDLDRYDAIAIFDADNLAMPDWLARMNDFLAAHPQAEVVQGYLDSKNPDDSWVTRVYALQYWYLNRFWSLARSRWGLSVNVGGTGYVLRMRALRRLGWNMRSLTEDLELTCRVLLDGGRVHWNEAAVSYDEKPISQGASRRQRTRWLQGHYWLAVRYVPACLGVLLRARRFQYLDLLLHLLAPGRSAMSYAPMFVGLIVPAARIGLDPDGWYVGRSAVVWLAFPVFALAQIALQLVVAPSLRHGRPTFRYLPDVASYFLYGLAWFPMVGRAIARSRDQSRWVKTPHTKSVALADVGRSEHREAR